MKLPRIRALLFNSKCCIETKISAQTSCSARKGETDHESEKRNSGHMLRPPHPAVALTFPEAHTTFNTVGLPY